MAAYALSHCIARASAAMILAMWKRQVFIFPKEGCQLPCVMTMWRIDIKCKYMFLFRLKNLAHNGLILNTHSIWNQGDPMVKQGAGVRSNILSKHQSMLNTVYLFFFSDQHQGLTTVRPIATTGNQKLHQGNNILRLSWLKSNLKFEKKNPCLLIIWLVNSLCLSDAIWRQRSGSTLAQVMACCLMAPSH